MMWELDGWVGSMLISSRGSGMNLSWHVLLETAKVGWMDETNESTDIKTKCS